MKYQSLDFLSCIYYGFRVLFNSDRKGSCYNYSDNLPFANSSEAVSYRDLIGTIRERQLSQIVYAKGKGEKNEN